MAEIQSFGRCTFNVVNERTNRPIEDAKIVITITGDPSSTVEEIRTNSLGQIEPVELQAPPVAYSMEPSVEQPYANYNFLIKLF